jgi:hypothetical protein
VLGARRTLVLPASLLMTNPARFALAIVVTAVAVIAPTAEAQDSWTETVSFARSAASGIKVLEPDGYTVSIKAEGLAQKDSVPTVLRVPNTEAFYVLTFTAPSGATWSTKVETKTGQITELRVKHTSAASPSPAASRKFFGKFAMSKKSPCKEDGSGQKIDFVAADGSVAASFTMTGAKSFTADVLEGDYTVRTFRTDRDGTVTYRNTRKGSIRADGWSAVFFCSNEGGGVDVQISGR